MDYRHTAKQKLTAIVGILMLCAALVGTAGASGKKHHYYRPVRQSKVRITTVRQANGVLQANNNSVGVAALGGGASATCGGTSGNNTATGALLGVAANVNLCLLNTATGGLGTATTAPITQTATNTANTTSTSFSP